MTNERPHLHLHHAPGHEHKHAPAHDHAAALPLSLIAQSALVRVGAVTLVVALLWLAVLWAVSLP